LYLFSEIFCEQLKPVTDTSIFAALWGDGKLVFLLNEIKIKFSEKNIFDEILFEKLSKKFTKQLLLQNFYIIISIVCNNSWLMFICILCWKFLFASQAFS